MKKVEEKFDVAIIGAGPAGMMASVIAAGSGARVVLIEKNNQIGKKLLLTGNGKCNLTNAEFDLKELVKNYNNGEFLFHAFSVFGPKETIEFFEKLGVKTKIEKNKRVFPVSEDAQEVLDALKKFLVKNNVRTIFDSEVADVDFSGKKINKLILKNGEISAKKYILCTGGKSYLQTGSAGFGYKMAEKLRHTIVFPKPSLVPVRLSDQGGPASCWKDLQGISLKDIKINVFQNGKRQLQEEGEIMFTHFGISGPAVLNISGKVGDLLENGEVEVCLDLFPILNQEELLRGLEDILRKYPKQSVKNILSSFVPERLAEVLADFTGIDKDKIANNMSKIERAEAVMILKNFKLVAKDVLGFEAAMVTRGGVSLKEIDHKTMKSKIIDNLFFAGEIIDVDGKTGGFNLQACWSSGYLAGKSC